MSRSYFAIFAVMRTGSNLLEKTLAELGDTVCYGEAFNPGFIGEPRYHDCLGWDLKARDQDPIGFLAALRAASDDKIPGFRLFSGHDDRMIAHAVADADCRKIILRRDPLESYISLKIAKQTGQWMLRDTRRRIALRVTFDAAEFEAYQHALNAYYREIDDRLAAAGQQAFAVQYTDLSDRAVLDRLALFIGSASQVPDIQPIVRQNSPSLAVKVVNYVEMCEALGREPEDMPPPSVPMTADLRMAERAPVAFVALPGPAFEVACSLVYRYERRFFEGPSLSYTQLIRQARHGAFAPRAAVGVAPAGRVSFALTCHPAIHAWGLLRAELFGPDWRISAMRRHLETCVGMLPRPREGGTDALDAVRYRRLLEAFLLSLIEARAGTSPVPMNPDWLEQSDLIETSKSRHAIDWIADIDALPEVNVWLAGELGVGGLPPVHITHVLERVRPAEAPVEGLLTPTFLSLLRAAFPHDFSTLGYADWPQGWVDQTPGGDVAGAT